MTGAVTVPLAGNPVYEAVVEGEPVQPLGRFDRATVPSPAPVPVPTCTSVLYCRELLRLVVAGLVPAAAGLIVTTTDPRTGVKLPDANWTVPFTVPVPPLVAVQVTEKSIPVTAVDPTVTVRAAGAVQPDGRLLRLI